jgi:hypothetical protein
MKSFQCGRGLLVLAALLLSLSFPARADYLYTISYDEQTINGRTYAADSFSFTVASIFMTESVMGVPVPGGELDGFTFTSINTYYPAGNGRTFEVPSTVFNPPPGDVAGLYFTTDQNPNAVGTYSSTGFAGLGISEQVGILYHQGNGSLTIAETGAEAVPEPGSWLLLLSVVGTLFVGRRVHRRGAGRVD